ncbi:hypothetical protein LCGC14_3083230, partial [marine sediment metagenome]
MEVDWRRGLGLDSYHNKIITITDAEQAFRKLSKEADKYDDKYFTEVEKAFTGNPAFDYMPVFRYLSNNQMERWFNEIFSLISDIYEKRFISFEYKDFRKYQHLNYRFIDENFTLSALTGMKPIYNPPIFSSYEKKLTLNEVFKSSLETVEVISIGSPVSLLKKFVISKRIGRDVFVATQHGKKIENLLEKSIQSSKRIFDIIQKWTVNKDIEDSYLSSFYKIKDATSRFSQHYDKNSTNWAIFDNIGRIIANDLLDRTFPDDSLIFSKINYEGLDEIRMRIISEKTSSLSM